MQKLIDGYHRFLANGWVERKRTFESLAEDGQRPSALVIGCVDSRVDPGMIFDVGPGEILTVRNVANLVPPYAPDSSYHGTSAALEFGIRVLEIPHVIVLGHGMCGGIRTLLEGAPEQAKDFVEPWMSIAEPARQRVAHCEHPVERQHLCEREVIKVSLENLMTFPWIKDRVEQRTLQLHGAWFSIHNGCLMLLQPDGSFAPASENCGDLIPAPLKRHATR